MKKIIIAATIACVAAMSHGASVTWGGAFETYPGADGAEEGMQFALVYSATAAIIAPDSIDAWLNEGDSFGGGKVVQMHTATEGEAGNWAFAETWNRGNLDVNGFYAVIGLNVDGDAASFRDLGQVSGTTALTPEYDLTINSAWDGSDYLNDNGFTIAVAPEPTSGLLLLLGVAGLALRRRRA